MNNKSIKINYLYNLTYQILTIITPLITTPYVSRKLGADGIGIYSYTASIVAYFTMFAALGKSRYGQREISYSQNDIDRRSRYFWKIEILSFISTTLCLIVYFAYIYFGNENVNIYIVQFFSILAVAADITWFFQGLEEFGRIVKRNIIFKIIDIVFVFLVVKSKNDLLIYVFGLCLITLISNISLWPFLKNNIKKPKIEDLKFWTILPEEFLLFIPSIAISIYTVLDKTMIGIITKSSFQNGYYEQSLKISRMAMTIITSLSVVLVPRIGHYYFENKIDKVKEYMYKSYRFVWLLGIPLCLGLCAIASNLIPWFLGTGFEEVIPLLRVSSFLILAIGINNVTGVQYLIPTKRHNYFTITVIIGASVNLLLNIFFIIKFKSMGAVLASVIAESLIAILQLIIVRKELSGIEILKSSIKYLLSGLIMFITLYVISMRMASSVINTIFLILIGGFVYFVGLFILRDKFFISNINILFSKIQNRVIKQ